MKPKSIKIIYLVAVILMIVATAYANKSPITITSNVDKSRITIGDLITYSIIVEHDKDVRVEMPGMGANLGQFEIRDYRVHEPKKQKERIISRWDYIISTFFTGEFEIPPLTVKYTLPQDTTSYYLQTEKIKIVVESVKPSKEGDIRDIKPPVNIPADLWSTLRWIILTVLLISTGIVLFIIYRRKKSGKVPLAQRFTPPRPPHETALEELNNLKNSNLLQDGEIKKYYIRISEIIRRYIEGRYFITAMEMTTTEVLLRLSREDVNSEELRLFEQFLNRCDLVKFAKLIPSDEENEEVLNLAYEIINRTKVVLETQQNEANEERAEAVTSEEEKVTTLEPEFRNENTEQIK